MISMDSEEGPRKSRNLNGTHLRLRSDAPLFTPCSDVYAATLLQDMKERVRAVGTVQDRTARRSSSRHDLQPGMSHTPGASQSEGLDGAVHNTRTVQTPRSELYAYALLAAMDEQIHPTSDWLDTRSNTLPKCSSDKSLGVDLYRGQLSTCTDSDQSRLTACKKTDAPFQRSNSHEN
eukprot:gnl/TRDRNA2_/TRDRNA2_73579_c0_seq1.p1 gnl/TRDRNA2_/TRDRNA2_73579_c0~~gnl/TRDRNA2_/TRDRNA2_73579_c0_seq1.p1  ORF type:complete len:177 (+),score=1.65 gnl/TRDRNA2_/TRDRNA2_73579_c0_seq1:301-831(+)